MYIHLKVILCPFFLFFPVVLEKMSLTLTFTFTTCPFIPKALNYNWVNKRVSFGF